MVLQGMSHSLSLIWLDRHNGLVPLVVVVVVVVKERDSPFQSHGHSTNSVLGLSKATTKECHFTYWQITGPLLLHSEGMSR
jgi:hypothetical protein